MASFSLNNCPAKNIVVVRSGNAERFEKSLNSASFPDWDVKHAACKESAHPSVEVFKSVVDLTGLALARL